MKFIFTKNFILRPLRAICSAFWTTCILMLIRICLPDNLTIPDVSEQRNKGCAFFARGGRRKSNFEHAA